VVYGGPIKVTGRVGYWYVTGSYLYLAAVFAYGEQSSVGAITINEETSMSGVNKGTPHPGDGTTSLHSYLNGHPDWDSDDTDHWQKYAHCSVQISTHLATLGSRLVVRSSLGGKLVTPIGGGTATATTNPAVIAYDILTSPEFGNMSTSDLDDASFQAVEAFCDEDTGDGIARYTFVGSIYERDPFKACQAVLKNCNGYLYTGPDGKIHLWSEMMPPLITGTWSVSAVSPPVDFTIAEDSTAGAATTELEVGQLILFNDNFNYVKNIVDDDTVQLTSINEDLTGTSLPVRAATDVKIEKEDWITPPAASEQSVLKAPDKIQVTFQDANLDGDHSATVSYGSGTAKVSNVSLQTVYANCAVRAVKTKLLVSHLEPFFWGGSVPSEIGAKLSPGDIILIDTDLVTDQAVTVQQPIIMNQDGSYAIKVREFDPGAFSSDTVVIDSPPSTGSSFPSSRNAVIEDIMLDYSGTLYSMVRDGGGGVVEFGNSSRATEVGGTKITLPNDVPLYVEETGGTERQGLKMDTSNRLTLGDGNTPVYLNASTSGGILLPNNTPITAGWSVATNRIFYKYDSSANEHEVGTSSTSSPKLTLAGRPVVLYSASGAIDISPGYPQFKGYTSYNGDPSTSLFASSCWGIHRNTGSGVVFLAYNDGGTMKKVTLA
jgi:hypothetical protein